MLLRFLAAAMAVWACCCVSQFASAESRTAGDVVKGVDEAGYARESKLARYTVREKYVLSRKDSSTPTAEMTVNATYIKGAGKTYETVSESGSSAEKLVLHRVLQNERQLSQRRDRQDFLITSHNYEMSLSDLNEHDFHGRKCLIVSIKPKHPSPYLLDGKIWVDANTYHLVRVEGKPTADPSLWTGRPTVERDYTDVDGFPVATQARSISKQALLGETTLEIRYENYQLSQ
jgi:hypothetical protein